MAMRVKYLSEAAIEKDAEALLAEFGDARRISLDPPISIEDIVEKHLKLRIDFDDLHQVLGIPQEGDGPDIMGAIWVDRREICIDQSLDPEERPNIEGRYRFTLAHEGGGHWRLHRAYLASDPKQGSAPADNAQPAVICRSSQSKERVEWQADFYSSCLLMPSWLIFEAWKREFGSLEPRVLREFRFEDEHDQIFEELDQEDRKFLEKFISSQRDPNDLFMEDFAWPLAEIFKVSPFAMRIRLETLGLLRREVPRQKSLAGCSQGAPFLRLN